MTDSPETPLSTLRAALDIGSNAVKFTVMTREQGTLSETIDTERVIRLAEGLDGSGRLDAESIETMVIAVEELTAETGVPNRDIDAFGTWVFRNTSNLDEVRRILYFRTGLHLRLLSEAEEAAAGFLAVRNERGSDSQLATLDHGGGSTDLAWGPELLPTASISIPVGARRLASEIPLSDPPRFEEIERIRRATRQHLDGLQPLPAQTKLTLIGGAASAFATLARHFWTGKDEAASTLTPEALDLLVQKLGRMTLAERRKIMAPHHSERADVIVHSAAAMREILGALGQDTAFVSFCGAGHGVLVSSFDGLPLDPHAPVTTLPIADFPPLNRKGRRGEVLFTLVRSDGAIWLQRKETYPEGVFRLPGGGIDPGESSAEAVVRELAEETGLPDPRPHALARLTYATPDGDTIPFYSDLFLLFSGDHIPVTEDENEQVAAWIPCAPEELGVHHRKLLHLPDELHSWGLFRAAAIDYLRSALKRRAW